MQKNNYTIRRSSSNDLKYILKLFVDTVRTICSEDYNEEQINAWTSSVFDEAKWLKKIESQYFIVAEYENQIIGFSSLENNDYIDFLFVHKDFQNKGVANLLIHCIENIAIHNNAKTLEADVSITAKAFFIKKGFSVVKEQVNIRENIELINYKMIKQLA